MNNQPKRFLRAGIAVLALFGLNGALPAQTGAGVPDKVVQNLEYRNIGPTRGGRVTTVAGAADQEGTFYMGATGGGVWKTTDYGSSWKNTSDGYFTSPSIGAIRVAPSNNDIVYVGTGSDGIRSNVIIGKGMYRSADAGKTWDFIGLEKTYQIGAVEVHPENPDLVYVAAIGNPFGPNPERGVYRTKDGGKTWEQVLFVSDQLGAADLEFSPNDPNTLYATLWYGERKPWTIISGGEKMGGVYKSTDGGDTWKKLEAGLPSGLFGKADLAVSAAAPDRVYVLIEAPEGEGGVYRSDDRGENFSLVSTFAPLLDRPFYYCNLDADPNNADLLFGSSTQFWVSSDAGKNWKRTSTPHGDNHDIWIHPKDSRVWVQSNDGGANVTRDGGKTWSTQENQSTAELYQVEVDDQFPYWLYAGQQDNSTIAIPSLPPYDPTAGYSQFWTAVGGCETGPVVPKPGDPDIVYANCKGRFGVYNKRTGQEQQYYVGATNIYGHNPKDLKFRFQRVAPIHVSPHNPDVVYHTSQYVHKTMDDGKTWEIISPDLTANEPDKQVISGAPITRDVTGEEFYSTIYDIMESPVKAGVIWVGANDGPVHVTQDGGKNWTNVTPADLAPGGRIDCVEASPHQAGKAYFCSLRYQLDDFRPYIYKTEDYGKTWTLLTTGANGIPADYPVRVVREDPSRAGLLYAGTEFGMFISFDDGKNWQPFQQNLPITPITDIKVHKQDLAISTMGRGFWILDDLTQLHQLNTTAATGNTLFKPRDTYRLRYRPDNDIPTYPEAGVIIDYYLAKDAQLLQLDILDGNQQVIRSFVSSEEGLQQGDRIPDMATGFFDQGVNPSLKTSTGSHRLRWDMRHFRAWTPGRGGRYNGGPLVAPGTYTARLHIDGQSFEQSFKVLIDPRLEDNGVTAGDLEFQEELSLQIRNLSSVTNRLAQQVREKAKQSTDPKDKQTLDRINNELNTEKGRYMQPMLLDQINYLNSMLNQADQRPGKDAVDRFGELKGWYDRLQSDFDAVDKTSSQD
jgi:photosystem II stability/assembly factor-like uncharacterized protein